MIKPGQFIFNFWDQTYTFNKSWFITNNDTDTWETSPFCMYMYIYEKFHVYSRKFRVYSRIKLRVYSRKFRVYSRKIWLFSPTKMSSMGFRKNDQTRNNVNRTLRNKWYILILFSMVRNRIWMLLFIYMYKFLSLSRFIIKTNSNFI